MKLTEKKLESSLIYEGHIITVRRDTAELPDGKRAFREVVEHPGAVAVLPLDDGGNVIAVRQYRYPLGKVLLEVPAGKLDPGEDPRLCAIRELEEETGLVPRTLVCLGCLYSSPGFCNEVIHLYLARGLQEGCAHPDQDEFLERQTVPLSVLVDEVMRNGIHDAKTVAAVLKTNLWLSRGNGGTQDGQDHPDC